MSCKQCTSEANQITSSMGAVSICQPDVFVIEKAPDSANRIEQYRKEAIDRINEWTSKGMTAEQIYYDGFKWRDWVRSSPASGWNWAMWEQCQMIAASIGKSYPEKLDEQELFDNPNIDINLYGCANPDYNRIGLLADDVMTDRRNRNIETKLARFLSSKDGKLFTKVSLRKLWAAVVHNGCTECSGKGTWGATGNLASYNPFAEMKELLSAKSFAEALETEITVYRGVHSPERVFGSPRKLESWSTCPEVAKLFAEGYFYSYNKPGAGKVFERKIKFKEIKAFINPDGEYEVILKPEENIPF